MAYDDNEFQGQNLHIAGESCSKVSPVLHPYALPKFDFDDSLQGHLRFDSLIENEVFLGITSQEDNQWIEEYSRGNSGIEFSSSAVELRRNNVWSEATSSESVEMLLKSVGQEEKVVVETIIEQLDICDESGSLTKIMDHNLNQDDGKDLVTHAQNASVPNELLGNFPGFSVSSGYEHPHVRFTSQSQEAQISGGELDSVVISEKCNVPVLEEKVDGTSDVIQKEAENLVNESMNKELPEDPSVSRAENPCSSENVDASIEGLMVQENLQQVSVNASGLSKNLCSIVTEQNIQSKENSMDVPMDSGTLIVESCTYNVEKSLCVVPGAESVENRSAEISILSSEEPTRSSNMQISQGCDDPVCSAEPSQGSKCAVTGSMICSEVDQDLKGNMHEEPLAASANAGNFELQAVQDGNTKSEDPDSPKSNANSLSKLSPVKNSCVDENKYAIGKDVQQITSKASVVSTGNLSETGGGNSNAVGTRLAAACLPGEVLTKEVSNEDLIAGNHTSVVHIGDSDDEDRSLSAKISGSMQVGCEIRSSEPGTMHVDQDVSFNMKEDAGLPLESSDMDVEVVQAIDSKKNVDPSLFAEGSKKDSVIAHNFESDVSVRVERVAATESDKSSTPDTSDGSHLLAGSLANSETDDQPKSPIFGVSLVHQDYNEKMKVGFSCEGNSQNEIPQVESVVASASMNPSSFDEKEASPDLVKKVVHRVTPVECCNASQIEQELTNTDGQECFKILETSPFASSAKGGSNSEAGGLEEPKESMIEDHHLNTISTPVLGFAVKSDEHQTFVGVARSSECDADHIEPDGGSFSSLDKPHVVSPTCVSSMELSESTKDKQEATKDVRHGGVLPSKVADDVEDNIRSVPSSNATQEETNFTFEVNKSAGLGQADKGFPSYPTFQVSVSPKIMEGPPTDSSTSQVDAAKLHGSSLTPQNLSCMTPQIGVKSERKTRRKSVGKENARKGNHLKETPPARDSVRVEKSSVSLTSPATGHVIQFEEVKSNDIERGGTKPGGIFPLPKLPDLNNSTSIFQQPFTDNQQVQLRAQILVYGSLISGTTPEESHMIAAFGQSDGGRTWEGVWRACVERLHVQKAQANSATPMKSRSDLRDAGNRADQGVKHASIQNKIISSPSGGASNKGTPPIVSPMIPLSSPLWNIATPSCDALESSYVPRAARLDYHQAVSPLHSFQTPAAQNFSGYNPSWLSQGPFAGQWVAASPIPAFNTGPRFPALPVTEAVKLTPIKEPGSVGIKHTSTPVVLNSALSISPEASSLSAMKKATASSDQPCSDSKSRKRKKGTPSANVKRICDPQVASVSAPVVMHLPQAPRTEDQGKMSLLAQNKTDSVTAPVVSSPFSTSVVVSTPAFITSKSSPAKFLSAVSPTHHHPRSGDQNMEKVVISEEILSKVEESKLQAENAAELAAAAVNHCHGVWSQLERQSNSSLNSDDEAKLVSSAVSIAAAASVAKVAAAAAKIASNVAEQARSMVNIFLSNRSGNFDQSGMISLGNKFDKAIPDAILRGRDRSSLPNSIIYTAREAAWQRVEAASASSKHAENLNAIVKAAELAAEAVSQAGQIVAMSEPLPLRNLVEAGPEGYWKTPQLASKQQVITAGNFNGTDKEDVKAAPEVSNKGNMTIKCNLSGKENSGDLADNHVMEIDEVTVPITSHEKDKRKPRVRKGLDLSKTFGVATESEVGSIDTTVLGPTKPQVISDTLKENNIKEGCLVEVYKDDDKDNGAWFGANVLSLKDGKALVCYTEIQSDEGHLKEWVPLEIKGTEVPKIRVAHPVTTMRLEGTRKRGRTAATDFVWSSGDRVDVWIQDRWREGVVMETNKFDLTSLTVQFPAQGETSIVRSWFVRPTFMWKDGKWIECHTSERLLSSQGDTRQEKRLKLGSPVVESKRNDGSSENIDLVDSRKQEETRTLPLSAHESLFNVGSNSTRDDKKLGAHRTMKSGLQKEGPRVIFGVPKPGKKQKFMDVSKHYVADGSNKNKATHDSVKFTRYLIPQAPGSRGWKNNSRSDTKERQVAETKPRMLKPRKPPIPSGRTLTSSKSTIRDTNTINKTGQDSGSDNENQSGYQNQIEFGSSSKIEDAPGNADFVSSLPIPSKPPKGVSTSNKSERLHKRKFAPAGGKPTKVEKSFPELVEPRRSNRKIQPTSRLLEGLQSSMTISKIPAASHSTQRSHSKVTPKGNTNNG
ncbi:uncharacterized protein LOC112520708 isoform X2 [Cynara cardunculus var. scolymus]|uniref:uncharacterized protein LOC112520708 isoform X2 n=1 Tax=Cynara cardunculus var. scolymus TaxID=59895 RepID=UPI000D62D646|nr:uncharacterized protein LOC112520708 isoform X2 [Cynara cardunculus var. scolymus]